MKPSEAIEKLKDILEEATETEYAVCYVTSCDEEPLRMAIEALEKQIEYRNRIKSLVDTIENVCKLCDDEHCGLCEYDGAYQGESGDWVNECPGVDEDDCFELSREFKNKYIDWEETQNDIHRSIKDTKQSNA